MGYRLKRILVLASAGLVLIVIASYIRDRTLEMQKAGRAVEEAERLVHLGKLEAAIEVLDRAVKVGPAFFEARESLSHLYTMAGRPGKGIEVLQQGAKLFPRDSRIYLALGSACAAPPVNDYEKAVFYLEKTIRLDPRNLCARNLLARCYNWHGEREEARRQVEEILKLDASNAAALAARRSLERAAKRAEPVGVPRMSESFEGTRKRPKSLLRRR
jgi:Flp pilus assembly protein TadD